MGRNNSEQEQNAINIIRNGTTLEGSIKSSGDIRIDGCLKGNLKCEGKLVIGNSGIIEGEIICKNADVSGKMIGNVYVKELLQLKSTSILEADISTNKLSIEPGSKFTGTCKMGEKNERFKKESEEAKQEKKTHSFVKETA